MGSRVAAAIAAARRGERSLIRARVRNSTRAYPRVAANPASVDARAAIACLPARRVRARPNGGEHT